MLISAKGDNKLQLDFGNGVTLSTIWGYLNYCENHDGLAYAPGSDEDAAIGQFKYKYSSGDVEVMVSSSDEKWLKKIRKKYGYWESGENLYGYLPLNEWFNLLNDCRKYKA